MRPFEKNVNEQMGYKKTTFVGGLEENKLKKRIDDKFSLFEYFLAHILIPSIL